MEISVVVPVYNELENIANVVTQVSKSLEKRFEKFEILFINDGSTDGSFELLEKLKTENSVVKVFHFKKNYGKSAALAAGFTIALGDLIVMMDGDLQNDPEDIHLLIDQVPQYDMVNGMRATREDGLKRKIASKIGNGFRNFVTGDNIKDTASPLKLFKKDVAKSYQMFDGLHRFLPTLAKYRGYKVIEVPVRHYDRMYGVSKYKVFGRGIQAFTDVFAVKWMKNKILKYDIIGS
ncbi:MAG: glycosyltransferase family 2 protein [Fusobacteriaceae bacterium]